MSGPILPINIKNIMINSPSGDNDDVKPRESPTVPSASTALTMMLMFIGGGSLSTASGIKVVTFIVLILATYSYLRRDKGVTVLRREIDKDS